MLAFEPASRPGTHELAARLQRCSPEARNLRRKRIALITAATVIVWRGFKSAFCIVKDERRGMQTR